ncbi:hypothetical protein [Methylobacterium sp. 37f]|uniref:hypothetical protein n=1 Tax=Methylobacterium sp. 37f TaxID=2817058 RepID=UPI001FFD0E6A|nr:hypothetical protein [Methylobacterium sp. 37f]MCK2056632.1 hypothetical protein [Methylobacterium sp. 37f]
MKTSITHYRPQNPKRSGALEHRFIAAGPEVTTIAKWLRDNNEHGEWRMDPHAQTLLSGTSQGPAPEEPLRFKFEIHESATDKESARRTTGHIALLKMSNAGVLDLKWNKK